MSNELLFNRSYGLFQVIRLGELTYRFCQEGGGGGGGVGICYVGVYGDVPFSLVYILPEKSRAGYQF